MLDGRMNATSDGDEHNDGYLVQIRSEFVTQAVDTW